MSTFGSIKHDAWDLIDVATSILTGEVRIDWTHLDRNLTPEEARAVAGALMEAARQAGGGDLMGQSDRVSEGHQTSTAVADAIFALTAALQDEYGVDYGFTILGRGRMLGASNLRDGSVIPVARQDESAGLRDQMIKRMRAGDDRARDWLRRHSV